MLFLEKVSSIKLPGVKKELGIPTSHSTGTIWQVHVLPENFRLSALITESATYESFVVLDDCSDFIKYLTAQFRTSGSKLPSVKRLISSSLSLNGNPNEFSWLNLSSKSMNSGYGVFRPVVSTVSYSASGICIRN